MQYDNVCCVLSISSKAVEQIRRVFGENLRDNFAYFSIKTYVVGTH